MPYSQSEQEIIRIVKRRQAILENVGRLVGIVSLVAIVAFSARAVYKRVTAKPKIDDAVIEPVSPIAATSKGALPSAKAAATNPRIVDLSQRDPAGSSQPRNVPMVDLTKPVEERTFLGNASIPDKPVGETLPEAKQQRITSTVKAFFEARSMADFLPFVRNVSRVKPLMEDYYRRNAFRTWRWKGVGWIVPVEEKGFRLSYVQAVFEDVPPVNVVVEETVGGDYQVDWESTVHYCEMSWKDFQTTKPLEPKMFRLIASKADDSEVSGGGDEKKTTLRFKHPKEGGVIYGSFDKSDPRFGPLLQQLDLCQWKDAPVIVRLCYPGQAAAAGVVQIAGVEGKGWLILDAAPRG